MDQAQGDLKHARGDIDGGYYNWACFSAQQAAEKALKAVFQKMGAEAWGYSVADLLLELFRSHKGPQALMDAAMELDKAYIPTRYPNALPSGSPKDRYTKTEAERLTDYAEKIIEFCEGFYPKLDKQSLLIMLRQKAKELCKTCPIKLMIMFGSYARGNFTVASDVDLLIVYQGEERKDMFTLLKKTLNIPRLEIHLYSEKEYQEMKDTINKMIKGGIVVFPDS